MLEHCVLKAILIFPPMLSFLFQPEIDVAFRHPEYMLSRDLNACMTFTATQSAYSKRSIESTRQRGRGGE